MGTVERSAVRQGAALLMASAVIFVVAVAMGGTSDALGELYTFNSTGEQYRAIASAEGTYRLVNLIYALAALLALIGTARLAGRYGSNSRLERVANIGLLIGLAYWTAVSLLRATMVTSRAVEVDAGTASGGTSLTDRLIEGDLLFALSAVAVATCLITLVVAWRRSGALGTLTTVGVSLGAVLTAAFVKSDPLAINFLPPFAFLLSFLPLGVSLWWRSRTRMEREGELDESDRARAIG